MKHCVDEFLGQKGPTFHYACVCGRAISSKQPLPEEGDGIEVEVAPDGPGSCPECFPERIVAKLDGVALHPDLGGLEEDTDVIGEDHGEEEVLEEERVEG